MYIGDLHIHSKYSRATSKDCDPYNLDLWARYKGIGLVGTGDFTHAQWRKELEEALIPAEPGFYCLKPEKRLAASIGGEALTPRFVVTGEISSIYKKNGKTRKVHNVIILPGLAEAEALARKLAAIGNIHSDGRPILGLDCRDLLAITLETCPTAIFIPAHIWTPHFSLFGAFSGFDAIEECFEDLTPYIHALETGLSSDPPMNWRVSALDRFTLVSNSDAHSPSKLGREANLFTGELSYQALAEAINTGAGFGGTLEFFPEEGKYHWDGHRNCGRRLQPAETIALGGVCPSCGKKITIGVEHRVEELADRPRGYTPPQAPHFESLVPLAEIIAASTGVSAASKKTQRQFFAMLAELGPEFYILRQAPLADIARVAGLCVAKGIERLRQGKVDLTPGYDGEYGVISLFTPKELAELRGEQSLFEVAVSAEPPQSKASARPAPAPAKSGNTKVQAFKTESPNSEQQGAITAAEQYVAVIAGPGTGKTKTLVERVAYLIEDLGVKPCRITAVTFTNQAAQEMRRRLEQRLGGKKAARGLTIGTFHQVCLSLLPPKPLLERSQRREILTALSRELGDKTSPAQLGEKISRLKNGADPAQVNLAPEILAAYNRQLEALQARDLDDVLLEALDLDITGRESFDYLLIDEFQDINSIQRQLTRRWSQGGSLFVIGDPDQSIYGFRGADAQCFQQLAADFPTLRTITLRHNYRSTPEILRGALAVINRNSGSRRELAANLPNGLPIGRAVAASPFVEGVWLAKEISRLAGGIDMLAADSLGSSGKARPFSDMAVICRTKKQLQLIAECLLHEGIPCVLTGRDDYLEEDSVRGCLGFFRSLLEPDNALALTAALKLNWDFPQDLLDRAVALYCRQGLVQPQDIQAEVGDFGHWQPWLEALAAYQGAIAKTQPADLIARWRQGRESDEALAKLERTAVFHDTMADFLTALTLGRDSDVQRAAGQDYAAGAVRLMTCHGSKGLEFPVVFLAGVNQGTLPLTREHDSPDLEEERRLFFVAMTRAKEELYITAAGQASEFWRQLPPETREFTIKGGSKAPEYTQPSLF